MYQMRVKKNFTVFKSIRRRDMNITPRSAMINEIFHRDFKIDELNRKREMSSNDIYNIKIHKYKLKRNIKGR